MRPQTLTEVAQRILSGTAMPMAVKEFIDEYKIIDIESKVNCINDNPPLTEIPVANVFLAGLAEYIAFKLDIPAPAWINHASRFLREPVYMGGINSRDYMLVHTVFSMRRRGLFCGELTID